MMGWKAVRDHYRIEHLVQVVPEKGICIGSPYIHDILVISPEGMLTKPDRNSPNADINRYQREMEADPEKLRELALAPDTFGETTTVYTYDRDGEIVERQAEELGWPNVTTTGEMQYDNMFSPDRDKVLSWARSNAEARLSFARERVARKEKELTEARDELAAALQAQERFTAIRAGQSEGERG